jgi:ABC-type antimicrobial peptide transport system permease subunit
MARGVVVLATILLGIVPATFELLLSALQYSTLRTGVPEGIVVVFDWRQVVAELLVVTGVLAGYVALIFAAGGRVSGRVAVALSVGAIAMAYAAVFGSAYWLALPTVVAAIHAGH